MTRAPDGRGAPSGPWARGTRGPPGHERGPAGSTRRAAEFDVRAGYFILAAFLAAFFANFSFTVSFGLLFFDCLT